MVNLCSDLVWDENEVVLKLDNDNGVGFILRDLNWSLFKINKGVVINSIFKIYVKGSVVNLVEVIFVFVIYYVFDFVKVKVGLL